MFLLDELFLSLDWNCCVDVWELVLLIVWCRGLLVVFVIYDEEDVGVVGGLVFWFGSVSDIL